MSRHQPAKSSEPVPKQHDAAEVDAAILNAVRAIRFGSVEIVIHNGSVVHIESKERIRFVPRENGSKH